MSANGKEELLYFPFKRREHVYNDVEYLSNSSRPKYYHGGGDLGANREGCTHHLLDSPSKSRNSVPGIGLHYP